MIAAQLLSGKREIKRAELSFFENKDGGSYADVVRQAQILTCLAYKLEGG